MPTSLILDRLYSYVQSQQIESRKILLSSYVLGPHKKGPGSSLGSELWVLSIGFCDLSPLYRVLGPHRIMGPGS